MVRQPGEVRVPGVANPLQYVCGRLWSVRRLCACLWVIAAIGALLPAFARAGGIVLIEDASVAQYREAAAGVTEAIPSESVVDVSDADLAGRLKAANPDTVIAIGAKAFDAAKQAALDRPLVYCLVPAERAESSRLVTGVKLQISARVPLEAVRSVAPAVRKVGVIYNPEGPVAGLIRDGEVVSKELGLTLVASTATNIKGFRDALDAMASQVEALWLVSDATVLSPEILKYVLVFSLERKLPLFGFLEAYTKAGALASISYDYAANGREAARLALEIAKKPAEARAPVPAPRASAGGILSVNLKTARYLGLNVPAGAISAARQVFR